VVEKGRMGKKGKVHARKKDIKICGPSFICICGRDITFENIKGPVR